MTFLFMYFSLFSQNLSFFKKNNLYSRKNMFLYVKHKTYNGFKSKFQ